jgi:hypothetical protein
MRQAASAAPHPRASLPVRVDHLLDAARAHGADHLRRTSASQRPGVAARRGLPESRTMTRLCLRFAEVLARIALKAVSHQLTTLLPAPILSQCA